ncbi:N-6 DNA methylase [Desulfobacterales bacterium HSG2]|nr:N-6 DNA methylase [Desulfobacterales bacterium HSG2]
MLEAKYTSETPLSHRKDYGQFFTPAPVARLMAEWVLKDNPKTLLDPAFGLGVFYDEIKKIKPGNHILFTGYEIDKRILNYYGADNDHSDLTVINNDYLESDMGAYDGIICNPPYMRFQKFLNRHKVLSTIEEKTKKKLVGYSNISSVFLVKAMQELNHNGRMAFIMPFEFFNTGYGKEIKKNLLEERLLKQIIIFSNEKDIFPDATTTICILLCRKDHKEDSVKITSIENKSEIDNLHDINDFCQHVIKYSDLPYNKKWTPIISALYSSHKIPEDFCNISLYGAFKRGIATGANGFFALTKSRIKEFQLGENNICKCITKSQQIRKPVFTEDDFTELYNDDKPVYCLDVKDHNSPSVRNYIKTGEHSEMHKRYLTKTRNPWYKIEHRHPAPILFGVFNRGRLKVVRNYSEAINFTCFHSFYPNLFGAENINKLFAYFLSDRGQAIIKMNKRSYGNKLDKLEPGDLNDCLCPNQKQMKTLTEQEAANVIETAKSDEEAAIHKSNELVDKI